MNKLLFLVLPCLLFFTTPILSQYTISDHDLILNTFRRDFNQELISSYLQSGDVKKTNAALLTISQSSDTGFIKNIINLPFPEYVKNICFVLGQLGPSSLSATYLIQRLKAHPELSRFILPALGKTGDKDAFHFLINYGKKNNRTSGLSLSLYYFSSRMKDYKEEVNSLLINKLREGNDYSAAFAIYRLGPDPRDKEHYIYCLKQALRKNDFSNVSYLLACLRKLKYFPDNPDLFKYIFAVKQFDTRIEAVKTLVYCNFNKTQLDLYLTFLDDANPNVSRQAAVSLKDITLNPALNKYLYGIIDEKIKHTHLPANTKGELFLTLAGSPGFNIDSLKTLYTSVVRIGFILRAAGLSKTPLLYKWLLDNYPYTSLNNKLTILEALPGFADNLKDTSYYKIFLNALVTKDPPQILVALDGLDTAFITGHKAIMRNIINSQVKRLKNDPLFSESLYGYYSKSKIIDSVYSDYVLKSILATDNPYVRLYFYKQDNHLSLFSDSLKNMIIHNSYQDTLFSRSYSYAFLDSTALIHTSKGNIKIRLHHDIAPVSTGNFCYLAAKGYFNNNPFHRVVPGFVIQCGDPTGTGWSGPGYEIVSEFSPEPYKAGTVGMASSGKDTEGSQWFITTGNYPHLDGRYSVFGEVIEGQGIANNIDQEDVIIYIEMNK